MKVVSWVIGALALPATLIFFEPFLSGLATSLGLDEGAVEPFLNLLGRVYSTPLVRESLAFFSGVAVGILCNHLAKTKIRRGEFPLVRDIIKPSTITQNTDEGQSALGAKICDFVRKIEEDHSSFMYYFWAKNWPESLIPEMESLWLSIESSDFEMPPLHNIISLQTEQNISRTISFLRSFGTSLRDGHINHARRKAADFTNEFGSIGQDT